MVMTTGQKTFLIPLVCEFSEGLKEMRVFLPVVETSLVGGNVVKID